MDSGRDVLIVGDIDARTSSSKLVRTPLDMIQALERGCVRRVVLLGRYARDLCLAAFVRESFPSVDVVVYT
jgi:hypothetical protein